ncbi:apolipoprotein N-acyltransferase [Aurantiacibacter aquimixticola]|uniref:Apolipoprotein N-acyltransferase n=1 Tax=Aurantiacibacter aquimixticola TaxID=1958945 RepID=A0A419RX27_9SPHN|nr:apolipoprotein N-acyltransferase [Aurantiacibacter aquimixticola]RJY10356.1 apolipoprotein N-acyltransferase [Aurantiacibacter aquimixticola]
MSDTRDLPIIDTTPGKPWLWALALGLLSATGFEPLGLWPVALLAAGLFVVLAARAPSWKRAAWLGWLFGWAHFTLANYWIATAFTYQAEMPAVLGWIAVPLLAIYLAVYPALASLGARLVVRKGADWAFALVFAGAFVVTEWMRGWVFTGYAWNPFAMTLLGPFDRPGLAALSPLLGTYALSGLAILLGSAIALLAMERRWRVGVLVAVLIAAGMYWPGTAPREGEIAVTLVQPDIFQETLNDPREFANNYQKLARLSPRVPANGDGPRLVLWPESGMVFYLRDGYPQRYYDRTTAMGSPDFARRLLGATVGEDSVLLTGAVDLEVGADETGLVRALGARNSVTALAADGEILGGYSKAELVPYGEYLPMRGLLEPLGLSRLVAGSIDFWPGPGPQTLDLGAQGKVSVQICYEIIFAGQVTDRGARPDYIFNPSNEDWFDASAKPQFLAQSRMRAIEEGLPVLRATTTGISAVIDARGVVREYLADHVPGRIDTRIPPAASPTLFAQLGNILSLIWAALFAIAGVVAMRRAER